jgi:dolichol-phosphate mannosyltransferase
MNIPPLLHAIWESCPVTHILIVDDGSPDGTAQVVKTLQKNSLEKLFLLERSGKNGLGTAYLAGFHWALAHNYDAIIQMDADFSHDPRTLPTMLATLEKAPAVIGSRYVKGGGTLNWSFIRKCISMFGSFYARTILKLSIYDFTGGFNGWQSKTLRSIDLDAIKSQGYSFQIELKYRVARAQFPLKEIPIIFNERRSGQSKMSFHIVLEAILAVWRLRNS